MDMSKRMERVEQQNEVLRAGLHGIWWLGVAHPDLDPATVLEYIRAKTTETIERAARIESDEHDRV